MVLSQASPGFGGLRDGMPPRAPYDAHNASHVAAFARELRSIGPDNRVSIAAGISALGLMRPQFILRAVAWWRIRVCKESPFAFWLRVLKHFPSFADQLIEGAAKWAESGRDCYDHRSAGGFCQTEIDVLYPLLVIDQKHRDSGIEARRAETPKSGSVEDESPGAAQRQSPEPDNSITPPTPNHPTSIDEKGLRNRV